MSSQRLPPELVEEIFDHLHDNKRALKTCSLVCKTWLHPAYRRLFHDARLSLDRLYNMFDPQSKSTAAPFIRHLHIRYALESPRRWNEKLPTLDGFHSITSLIFEGLRFNKLVPEVRSTIFNRFVTITRLELRGVTTATFSESAQMICTFDCLEDLTIRSTTWRRLDRAPSSLRLPQRLHALELGGYELTAVLGWLSSFGHDRALRNLSIVDPWVGQYQVINAFLQILGPSLESFRIHVRRVHCPVQLHHNTNLRSLHIDIWRRDQHETGLAPILSGVASVHVEEISLSILHFPDVNYLFHRFVSLEWSDVDAILATRPFLNLKTVSVRHAMFGGVTGDVPYLPEWFVYRLPLCNERGILRM